MKRTQKNIGCFSFFPTRSATGIYFAYQGQLLPFSTLSFTNYRTTIGHEKTQNQ